MDAKQRREIGDIQRQKDVKEKKKKGRLEGGRRGCSRVKDERREIWKGEGRTLEL